MPDSLVSLVNPASPAIEVTHLSKHVADAAATATAASPAGQLTILRDVNFNVPGATTLAIVGASGSG
eukprot:gene33890-39529_t